jgi:hypothetical protein
MVLFRVFPDLESGLKIARKIRKNPEKSEKNQEIYMCIYRIDTGFRVLPGVSGMHFQIWKVRLCQMRNGNKMGEKSGKKGRRVLTVGDVVFRVRDTSPNMESEAVLNIK